MAIVQLFGMTVICSIGLLFQTIFMLVLVATNSKNNILTLCILLVVEALPSCFVLSVFSNSETKGLTTAKTQLSTLGNKNTTGKRNDF